MICLSTKARPLHREARREHRFRVRRTILLLIALTGTSHFAAPESLAAIILGTGTQGIGFVTVTSDTNGLSATLGRWDTAYNQGLCGPGMPGVEPEGQSTLFVDIDVQDGGVVSFSYEFATYDADRFKVGNFDWFAIGVGTPDGTFDIVPLLHAANQDCWGAFYSTGRASCTQDLTQWAHHTVTLIFTMNQDGYGDQSQGRITNLAIRNCAEPPLTALSTSAITFENDPTRVDTDDLTTTTKAALSCFQTAVVNAGGTIQVTSAFRPSDYQLHLLEVWLKWNKKLMANLAPECAGLRAAVRAEFLKHDLGASTVQPAGGAGPHTRGIAFDANVSGVDKDALAAQCGLFRPFPGPCSGTARCDTVHFQLR